MSANKQTDLSKRLRDLIGAEPGAKQLVIKPENLAYAAEEIERYYTGMLDWKAEAEAKDVLINELRKRPVSQPVGAVVADERAAFENYFSQDGAWPNAIERKGESYKLASAQTAWTVWQARADLVPQPAKPADGDGAADPK